MLCAFPAAAQTDAPEAEPPGEIGRSASPVAPGLEEVFTPPSLLPLGRYKDIWEKAPFALKTAAPALEKGRSFASEWNLAGLSEENGETTIYLKHSKTGKYLNVTSTVTPENDVVLVKVNEKEDPRQITVDLRKGDEIATVGYSDALTSKGKAAPKGKGDAAEGGAGAPGANRADVRGNPMANHPQLQQRLHQMTGGGMGAPANAGDDTEAVPGAETGEVPPPNVGRARRRILLPGTGNQAAAAPAASTTAPQVQEALMAPEDSGPDDASPISTEELPPP